MEDKILSLIRHSDLTRIANDLTSLLRYAIGMKTNSLFDEVDIDFSRICCYPYVIQVTKTDPRRAKKVRDWQATLPFPKPVR